MLKAKVDLPFPSDSDLQALAQAIDTPTLNRLLATEGVFFLSPKSDYAQYLTRFAFGQAWYAEAFRSSDRIERGLSISITGARANISDLPHLEEILRSREGKSLSLLNSQNKYQPKITRVHRRDEKLVANIEYQIMRPNHTTLFNRETHLIEVEISKLSDEVIEFKNNPLNAIDAMVARDIVSALLKEVGKTPIQVDITALPIKSRIDLIDDLLEKNAEWKVRSVTALTVRHGEDDDDDEGDEHALSEEEVKVLSGAILQGSNLREHEIVKQFLERNYYFTSVSFWCIKYNELGVDGTIKVEIDFKQQPKLLEINVGRMRVELDGKMEDVETSTEIARKVGDYFWNAVYRRYADIQQRDLAKAKKVARQAPSPEAKTPAPKSKTSLPKLKTFPKSKKV